MVLVHGVPTSSFLWRYMIKDLSAKFRVIALDLPGFGNSDPPANENYSIPNYASVFQSFLDSMSMKEGATLICHDFGGPVAITCALSCPEKFNRFVILDTFLHKDIPPLPFAMKIAKIKLLGEFFMWLGGKSIIKTGLQEGVENKTLITDEMISRYYSHRNADKVKAAMLGILRIDYEKDLIFIEQNIHKISKPTIIIWAENDVFLPYSLGERIHREISGSKMVKIEDCGHFLQEEKPEQAVDIIRQFLNEA